jgi:hypothetical protein
MDMIVKEQEERLKDMGAGRGLGLYHKLSKEEVRVVNQVYLTPSFTAIEFVLREKRQGVAYLGDWESENLIIVTKEGETT